MNLTTELKRDRKVKVEYWQGETSRLHDEWRREDGGFHFGGRFSLVWTGERTLPEGGTALALAEHLWKTHNMDDRPKGREIRSMSTGDVLVLHIEGEPDPLIVRAALIGFVKVVPMSWLRTPKQTREEAEARMGQLDQFFRTDGETERPATEMHRTETLEPKRETD